MDFLICSSSFSGSLSTQLMQSAFLETRSPAVLHRDTFSCLFSYPPVPSGYDGKQLSWVSGSALTRHGLVSWVNLEGDGAGGNAKFALQEIKNKADDAFGVYCLVEIGADSVSIHTDTLAQFPVFVADWGEEGWVVASSPYLIEELLSKAGKPLGRDPVKVLNSLMYGTTFGSDTAFQGVELPPANKITFEPRRGLQVFTDETITGVFSEVEYESYLDETVDLFRQSIRAAVKDLGIHGYDVVSDLTGGVDSRIILAALLGAGATDGVGFFSLGKQPRPDKAVADYLVDKYRLSAGQLKLASPPPIADYDEYFRLVTYQFMGMKLSEFGEIMGARVPDFARISGYYGEFLRVFYSEYMATSKGDFLDDFSRKMAARGRFLAPGVVEGFRTKVAEFMGHLEGLGLTYKESLQALYLFSRSKVHFGIATFLKDRQQLGIHPLCSARFLRLGMAIPEKDAVRGKVAFDLISALHSKELAAEPLADQYWHKELIKQYFPEVDDIQAFCKERKIKKDSPLRPPEAQMGVKVLGERQKPMKRLDKAFTQKMRTQAKPYQFGMLPDIYDSLGRFIEGESLPPQLEDLLDMEGLRQVLDKGYNEEMGAVEAKNLLRLIIAFNFLSGEEIPWQIKQA